MNTSIAQEQQDLHAQIAQARENIAGLEEKLRVVDSELENMSVRRQQYQLLNDICESLDKLQELGAAHLFWGERLAAHGAAEHVGHVRRIAAGFQEKLSNIEQRRKALLDEIQEEKAKIDFLNEELDERQEQEERLKYEFVVDREITPIPYRPMVMPWTRQGEDEKRFRKVLLIVLLLTGTLGYLIPFWELPVQKVEVVEIPERLVKLVKKQQPKPAPKLAEKKPEKKEEEKKPTEEKLAKKETPKPTAEPTPAAKAQARAKAEKSGVLAFKSSFSDLMEDTTPLKLGADARVTKSGQQAKGGQAQRSLVVAQAQGGSGGINTAALSRNAGGPGGAGSRLGGVQFTRVESGIGADYKDADRPLSKGPGPSRTDEEIQIVFDRYKAALYRIYNRELRTDPTLQGKMVLRLTIEPDGRVSACKVESTDLASSTLVAEIVERVKKFNFGAKDGVPKVTILYPIDFLPAG